METFSFQSRWLKKKNQGKLFEKRDNSNTVFTHNVILNMKSLKGHYIVYK